MYSSDSKTQHMELVNEVVKLLEEADARLKVAKIKLTVPKLKFLGRMVGRAGWDIMTLFTDTNIETT